MALIETIASAANTPRWLRPFQRVTSRGVHVREIDGLRFIALAMVLLLHLNHYVVNDATVALQPPPLGTAFCHFLDQGDFGVQLFFAISGFILAVPFARQHLAGGQAVSLRSYFLRRLTRLEPPLIIHLSLMLLLMVVVMHRQLWALLPHWLATCAYLHTALFGTISTINPMTWSLEVEAQFYLAMPLLARLYRIKSHGIRQVIFLMLIAFFGLIPWHFPKASLTAQLPYFAVGLALADVWWTRWLGAPGKQRAHDAPAFAAWIMLFAALFWNRSVPLAGAVLPVLLFTAIRLSLRSTMVSGLLGHWLPVTLGGMCYTFYLYHLAIISGMTRVTTHFITTPSYYLNYALHVLMVLPVITMICMALFAIAEKPFMRWRPGVR